MHFNSAFFCSDLFPRETTPDSKVHRFNTSVDIIHRADDIDIVRDVKAFFKDIFFFYEFLVLSINSVFRATILFFDTRE